MPRQFVDFNAYIRSEAWKKKSLERFKADGYRCQICGSAKNLVCHHLTYINLGHEDIDDLLTVCYPCHKELHNKDTRKAYEPQKPKELTRECRSCCREFPERVFKPVHNRSGSAIFLLCPECAAKFEESVRKETEDLKKYTEIYARGEAHKIKEMVQKLEVKEDLIRHSGLLTELNLEPHYAMTPNCKGQLSSRAQVFTAEEVNRIKGFLYTHHRERVKLEGRGLGEKWKLNLVDSSQSGLALVVAANEWVRCLPLMDGFNRYFFDNPSTFYDHFLDTASNEEEGTLKEIMRAYHAAYIEKGVRLT